jgi:Uma2 family endonuclease
MTLAEWGDLDEDEPGELVDGRLVEDEEAGYLHEVVVAWLIHLLHDWLRNRGGFVGASDARFAVSTTRGRKPDLSVYLGGRRPPAQGLVALPPDIMIEVVSPRPSDARRDRIDKMSEYAAFGVRYYWIVDPALRTFEIFELGADARYARALGATDGVLDDVPGCDGLQLSLDALWSEIDRLQADR